MTPTATAAALLDMLEARGVDRVDAVGVARVLTLLAAFRFCEIAEAHDAIDWLARSEPARFDPDPATAPIARYCQAAPEHYPVAVAAWVEAARALGVDRRDSRVLSKMWSALDRVETDRAQDDDE